MALHSTCLAMYHPPRFPHNTFVLNTRKIFNRNYSWLSPMLSLCGTVGAIIDTYSDFIQALTLQ